MITNEEARKAIEKYQKEHPLVQSTMLDVTAIGSKEGVDVINNVIEQVSKKVEEDTELWCICEMAKMYMQGVRPIYPVRPKGEREFIEIFAEDIPDDICTYPEYRGKPYYSIHYTQNGEDFVGFGTYSPKVLSRYLREYFFEQKGGEENEV